MEQVLKRYNQPEITEDSRKPCNQPESGLVDFTHKRVVTELAVRKGRNAGHTGLKLGKATIVTPLAMDYISSNSMTVVRQEE